MFHQSLPRLSQSWVSTWLGQVQNFVGLICAMLSTSPSIHVLQLEHPKVQLNIHSTRPFQVQCHLSLALGQLASILCNIQSLIFNSLFLMLLLKDLVMACLMCSIQMNVQLQMDSKRSRLNLDDSTMSSEVKLVRMQIMRWFSCPYLEGGPI